MYFLIYDSQICFAEEYGNTVVYEYDEKHHWTERQILPSFGVLSMDIITYTRGYKEEILLALGTGMNTEPLSYSTVYKWNNIDRAVSKYFLYSLLHCKSAEMLYIRIGTRSLGQYQYVIKLLWFENIAKKNMQLK